METLLTAWTPFGISGSVRRSHRARLLFIHERYHQHQYQQCTTVFVCTGKSKNGMDLVVDFVRQSGWQQCDMGFVTLQTERHGPCSRKPSPSDCSHCTTQRCTCQKHNIECSPACGNCRGSGCTNTLQMPCGDDADDDIAYL